MHQDQDQKVVDQVKTEQHTDVLQVHLVLTKKLKLALVLLNWTLSVYFINIFINLLEYCKLVINFEYLCYLERTWCIWWIWPWKSSTSINVIIFITYNYIIKKNTNKKNYKTFELVFFFLIYISWSFAYLYSIKNINEY